MSAPPDLASLKALRTSCQQTGVFNGLLNESDFRGSGWDLQAREFFAALVNAAPSLIAELERLRGELETLKSDPTGSYAMGEQKIVGLLGTANAEIKRLREALAKAKTLGAVEELERMAAKYRLFTGFRSGYYGDGYRDALNTIIERAAELRKELP